MLILITGAPGASKTSHAIDKLFDESRPVFFYNIALNDDGLSKLGWIEFTQEQVLNWHNELPANAILVVDEAQRIWPVRSPSKPVPESCTAMETHRHQGVDIILITQHPGLIDSHIRKLINEHYHYSRPYGMPFAIEYHSGSGVVSPDNRSELSACTNSKKPLPKRVWPLYKSAEVHTHKAKIPKAVYFVAIMAIVAVFLIWKFLAGFGPGKEDQQQVQFSAATQTAPAQPATLAPNKTESMTWAQLLTPEVPGVPFTAPLYREEAMRVQSVPRVAGCMTIASQCTCYTQQGTVIHDIGQDLCNQYLTRPAFNHMRPDSQLQTTDQPQRPTLARAGGEARATAAQSPAL